MNGIFVGEKRSGKTTLAFNMALESGGGIIVFDPKKEFMDWPATVSSVEQLQSFVDKKEQNVIIWRPELREMADESFDKLADWIMEKHALALKKQWDKRDIHFTLLVDEAYNLQSHAWINQKLMKILSECRPEILNVFQTFQSVKNVNSDSRSRVSDWFLFTITLPSDLARLKEFAQPEVIQDVTTLREHEYIHFINEKGSISSEIVSDADSWFVSLNYREEENDMPRRDRDDEPRFPLTFESLEDIFDFHSKHDRRKGEKQDTGHRERSSDNERRDNRRDDRGNDRGRNRSSEPYNFYRRERRAG